MRVLYIISQDSQNSLRVMCCRDKKTEARRREAAHKRGPGTVPLVTVPGSRELQLVGMTPIGDLGRRRGARLRRDNRWQLGSAPNWGQSKPQFPLFVQVNDHYQGRMRKSHGDRAL